MKTNFPVKFEMNQVPDTLVIELSNFINNHNLTDPDNIVCHSFSDGESDGLHYYCYGEKGVLIVAQESEKEWIIEKPNRRNF